MCRRCNAPAPRPPVVNRAHLGRHWLASSQWHPGRRGLTLAELMIAIAIMVIVMGALSALAKAVQSGAEYGAGREEATQHARVVLERISRMVAEATANDRFPGFIVVAQQVGAASYPDTLVVWHPSGPAVDPKGLPRYSELVVYTVDGANPNQLLEVTFPTDSGTVPSTADQAAWQSRIALVKSGASGSRVTLTELVRTCAVGSTSPGVRRGAARFDARLRPSDAEWAQYQNDTLDWEDLSWVQGIYGAKTGLRQAWLRIELQLMPGALTAAADPDGQQAIPFLGSAAVYYQLLHKSP